MSWDLDRAKEILGIDAADTTKDTQILAVMDQTLGSVETVLARKLLFAEETERFHDVRYLTFNLRRYPLQGIQSMATVEDETADAPEPEPNP